MNETLSDLLRHTADTPAEPRLDVGSLVREAGRRQRRRRLTVTGTAAVAVALVAVSAMVVRSGLADRPRPAPGPSQPSPSQTSTVPDPQPSNARPLVYADGATVHYGDVTFEADEPVAFISATDDGVLYEASLDHTLWFSDGTTTSVIGETAFAAAPTAHGEAVSTGDNGSLVVWETKAVDGFVVYDTSRMDVVGQLSFSEFGYSTLLYVDEDRVYFTPPGRPGCWALDLQDIDPCRDPHLFRFDVASGETTKIRLAELDAEMGIRPRMFRSVATVIAPSFDDGANFRQDGTQLVPTDSDGDPTRLFRADGDEVRLRLPSGYKAPGLESDASSIQVSQWLDDDHVVIWASLGGGDLPPRHGDLLVCRLPDGVCRVTVPESSALYVIPG